MYSPEDFTNPAVWVAAQYCRSPPSDKITMTMTAGAMNAAKDATTIPNIATITNGTNGQNDLAAVLAVTASGTRMGTGG
jgi:hypothetical protein